MKAKEIVAEFMLNLKYQKNYLINEFLTRSSLRSYLRRTRR